MKVLKKVVEDIYKKIDTVRVGYLSVSGVYMAYAMHLIDGSLLGAAVSLIYFVFAILSVH
ncbi:hypothetical protein [Tropicibacter sp. S64]|uniref:hypothetical protein n=1 Tax=Tropicibacter sp. S64 TaxID=3415122 RepID=UPI003C7D658A